MSRCSKALTVALLALGVARANDAVSNAPAVVTAPVSEPESNLYAAPTTRDRIGRIAAPVMINGQGPFRLILDTGANQSVITRRVADTLGLLLSPEAMVMLHGVTGSTPVPFVHLQSLRTGDLEQRDLKVVVLDSVMGGADGILGSQGFEGMRITANFRRDRLTITESNNRAARRTEGKIEATLRFGRLLVVDGKVGRIKVKAVIDTGAQSTLGNLALRDELLSRRRRGPGEDDATVVGLNEIAQSGRYLRTPTIELGDAIIGSIPVIYGDIHVFDLWDLRDEPALVVGMDVLGGLDLLVIDYRREEIQFRTKFRAR